MPRPLTSLSLAVVVVVITGCTARKDGAAPAMPRTPVARELVRPLDAGTAKVLTVNTRLRFAVLDYSLSPLPEFGQRLEVVREGRKVAELKVTGPSRGMTTAADIVSGSPLPGDVARPE